MWGVRIPYIELGVPEDRRGGEVEEDEKVQHTILRLGKVPLLSHTKCRKGQRFWHSGQT